MLRRLLLRLWEVLENFYNDLIFVFRLSNILLDVIHEILRQNMFYLGKINDYNKTDQLAVGV